MDADITIIGGGIHGCTLAIRLRAQFPSVTVVILDAEGSPLALWNKRTRSCCTRYLRSPASHTIDPDFRSLLRYAKEEGYTKNDFIQPYWRPSLELFNSHAEKVLQKWRIHSLTTKACVSMLQNTHRGWKIHSDRGITSSKVVILAPGSPPLQSPQHQNLHVFERSSLRAVTPPVAIIGAGMTGTQTALSLLHRNIAPVWLIDPQGIQISSFDSDPCFIGPACRHKFFDLDDYQLRSELLKKHRYPGTITGNLHAQLQEFLPTSLTLYRRKAARIEQEGRYLLLDDGSELHPGETILATGFAQDIPQKSLIDGVISKNDLPVTRNGLPLPNESLQWGKGLFVSGKLAELEVGPAALNIIGGHLSWRAMAPALHAIF